MWIAEKGGRAGPVDDGGADDEALERSGARRRRGTTIASIVVLVLATGFFTAIGAVTRSDASKAHQRTIRLDRHYHSLVRREQSQTMHVARLVRVAGAASESLDAFMATARVQADASNRAAAVLNHAADLFNTGKKPDALAVLQGDGNASITDLASATNELVSALDDVQPALADLKGPCGG